MRPGEIAQLEIGDIQEHEGVFWFDLRPFDPAKGRIAREDIKQFKTPAASRMIPIHPTLLELGLIERAAKLQRLGHTRLFPELRPTVKGGVKKWGHAMARDWQKRKHLVTTRCNVTAYSGRHGMAELLRELHIDPHDIEKFLGHAHPGVTGRYGRKGLMPATVVAAFINAEPPIISWVRTHLVDARDRSEAVGCLIESWAKKPAEDYR
jgi:integrase